MLPTSGVLKPGEREQVQVSFTPSADGPIKESLKFRIKDNDKRKVLRVQGAGHILRTAVDPSLNYVLGPVLPYDEHCFQEIVLQNPTDYPIKIFSPEFNTKYLEEEEYLREYPDWTDVGGQLLLELPVRGADEPLWKEVVEKVDRIREKRRREEESAAARRRRRPPWRPARSRRSTTTTWTRRRRTRARR